VIDPFHSYFFICRIVLVPVLRYTYHIPHMRYLN
jgi:hypothetical protein